MAKKQTVKSTKNWMEAFTTITPFSKFVALIVFITLPLLSFVIGVKITKENMRWTCSADNFRGQMIRIQEDRWSN